VIGVLSIQGETTMGLIRIGGRIINTSLLVEATDQGEVEFFSDKTRIVKLLMIDGRELQFEGTEADEIWAAIEKQVDDPNRSAKGG